MSRQNVDVQVQSNYEALDLSFLDVGFRRLSGGESVLRDDLLDSWACKLGERFALEEERRRRRGRDSGTISVTPAQLRRLFGEVKGLQRDMKRAESIDPYLARVRMLKSKVAYASGRENVTTAFEEFINKCIDLVRKKQDYIDFVLFFESIVGFFQRYKEGGAG